MPPVPCYAARLAFDEAVEEGQVPELLTTGDFDMALRNLVQTSKLMNLSEPMQLPAAQTSLAFVPNGDPAAAPNDNPAAPNGNPTAAPIEDVPRPNVGKGKAKKKKVPWDQGTKLAFFESRKEMWLKGLEERDRDYLATELGTVAKEMEQCEKKMSEDFVPPPPTTPPGTTGAGATVPQAPIEPPIDPIHPATHGDTLNAPDARDAPDTPHTPDTPDAPDVPEGEPDAYVQPPRPPIALWVPKKGAKRSDPPLKRGKPSWVRKELWLKAMEEGNQSDFYTKMAKLYVLKYGRTLADKEDFEYDVIDPPDDLANQVVNEVLSAEETTSRQKYHASLRDRIGAWYRTQYANLIKDDKVVFQDLFGTLTAGMRKKPKKPKLQHYYSSRFYDQRVASRVEQRLRALEKRAVNTGEKVPEAITVQNALTKEVLDEEPDYFVDQLKQDLDREYAAAVKAWQDSLADSPPRTAEEFSTSLKTAAYYLEPFVAAIGDRFGMVASLLMCGPVGARGGRIEMRSVHSGTTRGLVESDWPRHDPAGFRAVESSMVAFAHNVFSKADCDARITAEQDMDISLSVPSAPGSLPSGSSAQMARAASSSGTMVTAAAAASPTTAASTVPAAASVAEAGAAQGPETSTREGEGGVVAAGTVGEEGSGDDGGDGEEPIDEVERCWHRKDRSKWSAELSRAHAAFERGRAWGMDWATCVENFVDFEAARGYSDEGKNAHTPDRPGAVKWWLGRGRDWNKSVDLGEMGALGMADTFIDKWWNWWAALQPEERELKPDARGAGGGGMLTVPAVCDWGTMGDLHGKNGLLQVMGTLLWWGERVQGHPLDEARWMSAVDEVGRITHQSLRGYADPGAKGKGKARGKKRKLSERDEGEGGANEEESGQPRRGRSKNTEKNAGGEGAAKRGRKRKNGRAVGESWIDWKSNELGGGVRIQFKKLGESEGRQRHEKHAYAKSPAQPQLPVSVLRGGAEVCADHNGSESVRKEPSTATAAGFCFAGRFGITLPVPYDYKGLTDEDEVNSCPPSHEKEKFNKTMPYTSSESDECAEKGEDYHGIAGRTLYQISVTSFGQLPLPEQLPEPEYLQTLSSPSTQGILCHYDHDITASEIDQPRPETPSHASQYVSEDNVGVWWLSSHHTEIQQHNELIKHRREMLDTIPKREYQDLIIPPPCGWRNTLDAHMCTVAQQDYESALLILILGQGRELAMIGRHTEHPGEL
ncbi:hypothetical protein C8R43DRAFT_944844 [Mycena crocata]|nr:hypothetical protein C8R43DRAFT_944844 [Mycena crocata]